MAKLKWNLVYSDFNPETGVSEVHINTSLGVFKGKSYLHEEDKDIASKFQGCRYAEMRAVSHYVAALIKELKVKYDTLLNLSNDFKDIKIYRENKYTNILNSKLKNLDIQIKDLELYKKKLDESVYYLMKNYRDEVNGLKDKLEQLNKKTKKVQEPTEE